MSRSSGRGQVDPLPALVAVAAITLGLSTYAGVLDDALPETRGPDAEVALDAVYDAAARNGIVRPARFDASSLSTPTGRRVNATLDVGERRWTFGPRPPDGTARADRRVPVALAPGRVTPGELEVVVW